MASMHLGGDVDRLETETHKWVTELSLESKTPETQDDWPSYHSVYCRS